MNTIKLAIGLVAALAAMSANAQQAEPSNAPSEPGPPAWPVSGIWMPADAKDLGRLTGQSWLDGIKFRGWVDGYYVQRAPWSMRTKAPPS